MIEYEMDTEKGLLMMRLSGPLLAEEVFSFQSDMADRPELPRPEKTLVDLRGITENRIQPSDIHKMAENSDRRHAGHKTSKSALIATRDDSFGLGRMFQLLTRRESEMRIFRSLEPALAWLGLELADVGFLIPGGAENGDEA